MSSHEEIKAPGASLNIFIIVVMGVLSFVLGILCSRALSNINQNPKTLNGDSKLADAYYNLTVAATMSWLIFSFLVILLILFITQRHNFIITDGSGMSSILLIFVVLAMLMVGIFAAVAASKMESSSNFDTAKTHDTDHAAHNDARSAAITGILSTSLIIILAVVYFINKNSRKKISEEHKPGQGDYVDLSKIRSRSDAETIAGNKWEKTIGEPLKEKQFLDSYKAAQKISDKAMAEQKAYDLAQKQLASKLQNRV